MKVKLLILISVAAMSSGCVCLYPEIIGCSVFEGKQQDHCFQKIAIQFNDADRCANIQASTFSTGQAPAPRDKCYMLIAEDTADPRPCGKIQGGP